MIIINYYINYINNDYLIIYYNHYYNDYNKLLYKLYK